MKYNRIKIALVYLVIAASIACKDDSIRKAARACDDIGAVTKLAASTTAELAKAGLITATFGDPNSEDARIMFGIKKINDANRVFKTTAMGLQQVTPDTKIALREVFKAVTDAVTELNNQGILGIKNESAKAKLTLILATINSSIAIIQGVLV